MDLASENIQLFREYEGSLASVRRRAYTFDSFYRGKQYTKEEENELSAYGMMPLVVNVVKPFLGLRRAILTSSRPTLKVVPLQESNKLITKALEEFVVGKWNADYCDTQLNLALKDMLNVACGWMMIDHASYLDNATFDFKVKHINWRYVYPDPEFKEIDASDAENIFVAAPMVVAKAMIVYGLSASEALAAGEVINAKQSLGMRQQVQAIDRYTKYPINIMIVEKDKGKIEKGSRADKYIPSVFYTNNLDAQLKKEGEEFEREMKQLESEGILKFRKKTELNIKRVTSFGKKVIYAGVMPIRDYPLIPFIDEFNENFSRHQGEIDFLEGVQKVLNKSYTVEIYNALLNANTRWLAASKSIKDLSIFQKTAHIPGAVIEYERDPTDTANGGRPTQVIPGNLANSFSSLKGNLVDTVKLITNTYGPTLGDASDSPETFATTSSLQSYGTQPIKELARRVDVQVAKVGEVMIQFIQGYADKNQLLEYLDVKTGEMTKPMDDEGQPIILNETVFTEGVVSDIKNNSRVGTYAYKVLTQPNLGTERLMKGQQMQQMVMNGQMPALPEVIQKMFDYLEIDRVDGLIQALKDATDKDGQIKQLEEQLKALERNLGLSQDEVGRLNTKVIKSQTETEMNKIAQEFKSKSKEELMRLQTGIDQLLNSQSITNKE